MLIYIKESSYDQFCNSTVKFTLIDCDYAFGFDAFVKEFGDKEIECDESDVFAIMTDIDTWYIDTFKDGCVRFEFG